MTQMHNPPHPGELLREWLKGHSVTNAASALGVSRVTLSRLLHGNAGISAAMDLRLSAALGTTPGYWLALQSAYDLWMAQRKPPRKVRKLIVDANRIAA